MSVCLSGCERVSTGFEDVLTFDTPSSKAEQLEKQELEDPISKIHVLVDRNGYELKDTKKVFFDGIDTQEDFRIIDKKTKKTVYTGMINHEEKIAHGVFSDWDIPGDYYIEIDKLGRSYDFAIQDSVKQKELEDTIGFMTQKSIEDMSVSVIDMALSIHVILQAIKCYPDVFEKDNTLISWMTKTVDDIHHLQSEEGSFYSDYEATAICAGILWMCGEEFGRYDEDLAKGFQKSAENAKAWMNQHASEKKDHADFYYMCQYFKAHPFAPLYKQQIEDYLKENMSLVSTDVYSFLGAVLYISSEKNTDRDLCTKVMQTLVSKTEDISVSTKKSSFFVESVGLETIMNHVLLICFIDYITPSREYMEIIENTMHYLSGTNINNLNYMQDLPEWKNLWTGICIFCYSDMNA